MKEFVEVLNWLSAQPNRVNGICLVLLTSAIIVAPFMTFIKYIEVRSSKSATIPDKNSFKLGYAKILAQCFLSTLKLFSWILAEVYLIIILILLVAGGSLGLYISEQIVLLTTFSMAVAIISKLLLQSQLCK